MWYPRSNLGTLQGLFFYFQCLPCCKSAVRVEKKPLLDENGDPNEMGIDSLPFGVQRPVNAQQDQENNSGAYNKTSDNPNRFDKSSKHCVLL